MLRRQIFFLNKSSGRVVGAVSVLILGIDFVFPNLKMQFSFIIPTLAPTL